MTSIPALALTPSQAFALAVERIGSQTAMAKLCEVTQGAVSKRIRGDQPIWPDKVLKVEAATGISRHELRPDLYPREEPPAHPSASGTLPSSNADGSSFGPGASTLAGVRP